MNAIAQLLIHSIQHSVSNLNRGGYLNKILLTLKFIIRKLMLKFRNPLIKHKVGKYEIFFPLSHNLPIDSIINPIYSTNIARIASLANEKFQNFTFIDIGANVGDTLALLRSVAEFPVLCIEGDEEYYSILTKNVKRFHEVIAMHALIGERDQDIHGIMIPNYSGSKQVLLLKNSRNLLKFENLVSILEKFPAFLESKMIKIDTDGYDCKIIRGSLKWLEKVKPIIFFEYAPPYLAEQSDDGISIFSFLNEIEYKFMLLYASNGDFMFSSTLDNQVFIEELHSYFSGPKTRMCGDICVFQSEDDDLFEVCRRNELNYFKNYRQQNGI